MYGDPPHMIAQSLTFLDDSVSQLGDQRLYEYGCVSVCLKEEVLKPLLKKKNPFLHLEENLIIGHCQIFEKGG